MAINNNDANEIPPLTDAYHKARRQQGLFSAILIFWEYVGIKIGEKEAQHVTTKLPQTDLKITILNQEAIPLIIFLLVIYFSVRLFIEWLQCDPQRREYYAFKFDLRMSFSLAFIAIAAYIFQQLSEIRIAEILTFKSFLSFAFAGALLLSLNLIKIAIMHKNLKDLFIFLFTLIIMIVIFLQKKESILAHPISLAMGGLCFFLVNIIEKFGNDLFKFVIKFNIYFQKIWLP